MQNVFMCFCNLTRKTDWLIDLDVRGTTYFFSFMHCNTNNFRVQGRTESTNCISLIITVILQRCERSITTALSFTSFINGQTIWPKKREKKNSADSVLKYFRTAFFSFKSCETYYFEQRPSVKHIAGLNQCRRSHFPGI